MGQIQNLPSNAFNQYLHVFAQSMMSSLLSQIYLLFRRNSNSLLHVGNMKRWARAVKLCFWAPKRRATVVILLPIVSQTKDVPPIKTGFPNNFIQSNCIKLWITWLFLRRFEVEGPKLCRPVGWSHLCDTRRGIVDANFRHDTAMTQLYIISAVFLDLLFFKVDKIVWS